MLTIKLTKSAKYYLGRKNYAYFAFTPQNPFIIPDQAA